MKFLSLVLMTFFMWGCQHGPHHHKHHHCKHHKCKYHRGYHKCKHHHGGEKKQCDHSKVESVKAEPAKADSGNSEKKQDQGTTQETEKK